LIHRENYLLPKISIDVAMTFSQMQDEAILTTQTFEFIYAQYRYGTGNEMVWERLPPSS